MSCASCGPSGIRGVGHFGAYIPVGPAQILTNTGPVVRNNLQGIFPDTWFGPTQTQWITGVDNEWVAGGVALVLLLMFLKK